MSSIIKQIYYDMRLGQVVLFPVLSLVNFVIISYSLTEIGQKIPIEIYIPAMILCVIVTMIILGKQFRKRQQSTDLTTLYQNDIEMRKDMLVLFEALKRSYLTSDPMYKDIEERIAYQRKCIGAT